MWAGDQIQNKGDNTFHLSWKDLEGYAFPPFSLIGKCLQKVRQEQSTIVLVAPLWQNQTWYPMLLEWSNEPAPSIGMLKLATWRVSDNSTQQQEFQRKLLNYCWPVGAKERTRLTSLNGSNRVAGVRDGKLIPEVQPFLDFITSVSGRVASIWYVQLSQQLTSLWMVYQLVNTPWWNNCLKVCTIQDHPAQIYSYLGCPNCTKPYHKTWG